MGCLKLKYQSQQRSLEKSSRNFLRVVGEKKHTPEKSSNYYAFGSLQPGRNFNASDYRYGLMGYEKDDEWRGITGADYSFGDYGYDALTGRRKRPDPKAMKYPGISPYAAFLNNPINVTDPDGKDVYLVIWATADGEVGHAGIAVDNYRTVERNVIENGKEVTMTFYEKTGTFTYYDLWPGNARGVGISNASVPVDADYQKLSVGSLSDLKNTDVSGRERGIAPTGVIKLKTNYPLTQKVVADIEKFQEENTSYIGTDCNCSDFAEKAVESATKTNIDADEDILFYRSTTPNKLFRETAKQGNATIIKDPGDKINKTFLEGAKE